MEKGKYIRTEEHKKMMSDLLKGENNPAYGKHHSEEWKRNVSKKLTGEKNPFWKGGYSVKDYVGFTKYFKEMIKNRDNYTCLKCGISEIDALKIYKKGLNIHHIDYDKKNTFKENCCSLCLRCHIETNANRKSWIKFFQSLLSNNYGYKYSEMGEIIIDLK